MLIPYITAGFFLVYGIFITVKYQQGQKKACRRERENSRERQKEDLIFRNVNAYLLLIGKDFVVQKTNYYSLNGIEEDKSIKRVGDLLHCKNAVESGECGIHACCKVCGVRVAIGRAFYKRENFDRFEASMQIVSQNNKQITPCDVHVSGNYLNTNDEELMLLTVYDISELRNTQRLLQLEQENSRSCDKLKNAFIANMSHEIRTPMNAIVGFSSLLATASSEEEKNMYTDIINQNSDRLLQLISDILDLSQIEAGSFDFHYSEFNANDLLRELYALFNIRLVEKPEVMLVCEADLAELTIYSERQRIMQVFMNLLTNAMKFTQKGEICFGCRVRDGKELYCYVRDSGIGISSEEQSKIFSRFTKLDREVPGTGLGLTLSQTVVEKLGGKIGVRSQQGEGSTFWFVLPLTSES
ncbi:HAMP domain-containing sensor histidine kinase [Bacteroides sp. 41_26]|uniref:sensor histidine kinase n=1 Tax=Bacteroides sp. 41_26 TaxID=1896973 RepID=UPI00259C9201|nr:HAMP domain-containing sensor histidine kinase [Bacteroides sp. 41_26]